MRKIGILGPMFHVMSIVYSVIYYAILSLDYYLLDIGRWPVLVLGMIFIGFHLMIFVFLIFLFGISYFAAYAGKGMMEGKERDKTEMTFKTLKYRLLIPLIYCLLPVPLYLYYITDMVVFLPFAFYPIWFPFVYKYAEKRIREYEKRIGSSFIKYHDSRMY